MKTLLTKHPLSFYSRPSTEVAPELIGCILHRRLPSGEEVKAAISEVEAYMQDDEASHSFRGLTTRTSVMFGPPARAYVYFIYGMYYCVNVVTERAGHASAVLLRAVEPVKNLEGRTCGPGLLCRAMKIDKALNGHDLLSDDFFIAAPETTEEIPIVKGPRIGVDYAKHWARRHLRFYLKGNPHVSRT